MIPQPNQQSKINNQQFSLLRGIPRKLQIRQPDSINHHLVRAYRFRRFKPGRAPGCNVIILVDAISAHSQPAHQHSILIKRKAPWKKHNSALIRIRRLRSLRARVRHIVQK
jgi:hypothetical protein